MFPPINGRVYGFALVLQVVALFASGAVQAEEKDDQPYMEAIRDGLEEYRRGNWEEARAIFKYAHQLQPSARTLRALGMACFEAKRYVEAIDALKGALEDKRKPLTGKLRYQVEKILARAERYMGRIELELEPRSARVEVDGRERRIIDGSIYVDPGQRELRVSAEGYRVEVRNVTVDSAEKVRIALTLRREDAAPTSDDSQDAATGSLAIVEQSTPAEESNTGADSGESNALAWVIVGGSGAVAVTGAVLFGLGMKDKYDVENIEMDTRYDDIKPAEKRVPVFTAGGAALFGAGVAGIVTGLVLLSMGGEQESAESELSLTPGGVVLRCAL